ncbi:MAG: single-stranded DNA-binding protein [Selenomonadaceae bacterium]|nr:single-stranded DNA-binding protein [Selenomonadaceae bacterium]
MNKVILMGNLTRDVEIRDCANNTTVARAGIAVNRPYKNKEVDFFNLVAFNETAEFLSKYFAKGSKILVEGYLRTSNYEDRDGVKRTATDIIIEQIEFAGTKKDSGNTKRDDFTPPPDFDYPEI